jgi:hypothetical protein
MNPQIEGWIEEWGLEEEKSKGKQEKVDTFSFFPDGCEKGGEVKSEEFHIFALLPIDFSRFLPFALCLSPFDFPLD